jgi:hypothetical protein
MSDRMISINKSDSVNVNLRKNPDNLIFCQMAYDNVSEQLYGETVNLASSLIVQAASTQINMVANGDETGIISEMVLSSIPNQLVRGCVIPSMSMDISLVAMNFSELSTAALEIANMIVQRSRFK